jgi:hypothetical protein
MYKRTVITLATTATGLLLLTPPVAADNDFGALPPCSVTSTTTVSPQAAPSTGILDVIGGDALLGALVGDALVHGSTVTSHRDTAAAEKTLKALMDDDSMFCACDGSTASTSVFDTNGVDGLFSGISGSTTMTCANSTVTSTSTTNAYPRSLFDRIGITGLLSGILG